PPVDSHGCASWTVRSPRAKARRSALRSPVGLTSVRSAKTASRTKSTSCSRFFTCRYRAAATLPSSTATARIVTASSPPRSASSIAVRTMTARLSLAGRPVLRPVSRLASGIGFGHPPSQGERAIPGDEPGSDLGRATTQPLVSGGSLDSGRDAVAADASAPPRTNRCPELVSPLGPEELVGVLRDRNARDPRTQTGRGDAGACLVHGGRDLRQQPGVRHVPGGEDPAADRLG